MKGNKMIVLTYFLFTFDVSCLCCRSRRDHCRCLL